MNLVETKLNYELIKKISTTQIVTKESLIANIGNRCMLSLNNDKEILSLALVEEFHSQDIEDLKFYLCKSDYDKFKKNIYPTIKNNCIWINIIQSYEKGLKAGSSIVDYLKERNASICLLADANADNYWIKQNFINIGSGIFIWSRNKFNSNLL